MMNIKIVDPIPESEVIVTLPFGSHTYGTANEYSDEDFVKIIKQDTGGLILQYCSEALFGTDVDFIYVSEKNFWKMSVEGANTAFFEALHTPEFQEYYKKYYPYGDYMGFLLHHAYNSWQVKAMLGMAKRDTHYPERAHHVARCIWMAEKILKKELINLKDVKDIPLRTESIEDVRNIIATLRASIKY